MAHLDLCLYLKGLWEVLQVPRDLQVLRHLFKMVLLDPKDPRDLCLPKQDLWELKMVLCLVHRVLRYLQRDLHWVKMVPLQEIQVLLWVIMV